MVSKRIPKNTVIFLGAGASAAEGAPIQSQLFKAYFSNMRNVRKYPAIYQELSRFFKAIFSIDLGKSVKNIDFPTFEEALGILDLLEMRRESLRGFDVGDAAQAVNRTQLIRLYLTLAMSKAISDGLKKSGKPPWHQKLVNSLRSQGLLTRTIFVSTNYDLLVDGALGFEIDYGVEFSGQHQFGSRQTVLPAGSSAVKLLKLHGSLNWLYCPVCNNLNSWESKAVLSLMSEVKPITRCEFCQSVMSPVIVPPTFYKDMSRVFLSNIWNKTENALRDVENVIFCGYSLPDADMHIKYLLKRVQTNRNPNAKPMRLTLVNHHSGKSVADISNELARYSRYFGKKSVRDSEKSFQDFATDPKSFYVS
jgi:NAD-dependent SIR2 family protein deacetylase